MQEKILVIGHGAREHALAQKISLDHRHVNLLFGNAGIARDFECIQPHDVSVDSIVDAAKKLAPDLIIIGPENFLSEGLADALRSKNLTVFGPNREAAKLEACKNFTKQICKIANVATANSTTVFDFYSALLCIENYPSESMVIKVNGLCAGKGVRVCHSKAEAKEVIHQLFFAHGFSHLGVQDQTLVIEDFLSGSEISVFGVVNHTDVVLFCPMQDHKQLLDFDQGPNTGGMGAVGPIGNLAERTRFLESIKEKIFLPALKALHDMGIKFSGLLYAGLMLGSDGPKLLEFNVRFGDPETQALLFGTRADIYPLVMAMAHNRSHEIDIDFWQQELLQMEPSISIVLASGGYPFNKSQPEPISLPAKLPKNTQLYFAATGHDGNNLTALSGRVLNVVARANTVEEARAIGYGLLSQISFKGMQYRSDIGARLTKL